MKYIIVALAFLISTSAFAFGDSTAIATGVGLGGQGGQGGAGGAGGHALANAISGSNAVSNSSARSNSSSYSNSGAYANQYQGQSQNQLQGQLLNNKNRSSSNNNGGNVAISNIHRKNLRSAPSFGLPAAFPTAVCQGTIAAGFSFWLGGGAAAGTITIEECMKLETIRVGTIMMQNAVTAEYALAQQEANVAIFCLTKYGAQTPLCPEETTEVVASVETVPAVSVVEPVKVAGIPDETFEPEVKRAKIWFFGL